MDERLKMTNAWSHIVPNSFIRALNEMLEGKVTVDLIPGEDLYKLITLYSSFGGTKFHRIEQEPLTLDGLIVDPRILKQPLDEE